MCASARCSALLTFDLDFGEIVAPAAQLIDEPVGIDLEVEHDANITAKGSKFRHMVRVEVYLNDGRHMERTAEYPRGSEHDFASQEEIVGKFEKLAAHAIPSARIHELKNALLALEEEKDVRRIVQLMAAEP